MSESIDQKVGRRIRFYRTAAGMKQKDLAGHLDVTYQQVQKYETGKDRVSIEKLLQCSRVLNVAPSAFLKDSDEQVASDRLNRQSLAMMRYFTGIEKNKHRQYLLDIAKALYERNTDSEGSENKSTA